MEILNDFANYVGFEHFKGLCLFFGWLSIWTFLGLGIYYGNKPNN